MKQNMKKPPSMHSLPPPPLNARSRPRVPTAPNILPSTSPPSDEDFATSSDEDSSDEIDLPPPTRNRRRSMKGFAPAGSMKDLLGVVAATSQQQSSKETKTDSKSTVPQRNRADSDATAVNPNSVGSAIRRRVSHLGAALNESWYWLKHPTYAYVPARKISGNGKECVYETLLGESMRDMNEKLVENGGDIYSNSSIPSIINLSKTYYDMVHMDDTNEASILHNVRLRFDIDLFMTNVGTILVLVSIQSDAVSKCSL